MPDETTLSYSAGDSLSELIGAWDVRRLIVDHRAEAAYRFVGRLRLTEESFLETGTLRTPHGTLAAERAYRLRPNGSLLDVLFADGRPFVALEARASQPVSHDCGADLYRGRILFRDRDEWAEYWRVAGPSKRYASFCRYRRATGGAA